MPHQSVESTATASNTVQNLVAVANRVAAALVGGYAFTWGVVALGMTVLVALGVDYHEAEMAMMLLAFLVFLTVFLWAFAAESMPRVWALLAGGAVVMILAASTLQASLIG